MFRKLKNQTANNNGNRIVNKKPYINFHNRGSYIKLGEVGVFVVALPKHNLPNTDIRFLCFVLVTLMG